MTLPSHAALTKAELLDRYAKGDRNFEQTQLHDTDMQGVSLQKNLFIVFILYDMVSGGKKNPSFFENSCRFRYKLG